MSDKLRPSDYLAGYAVASARRDMAICWIVMLSGVLSGVLWTQYLWHILLALMVVHVMVR